jgi:hypothetical protein
MIAPVDELTASTTGTDTKLVPVIVILVASLVIADGDIEVTVGLVSVVTDPPKLIAAPLIVIELFCKSAFVITPSCISVDVIILLAGLDPKYPIFLFY